MPIQPDGADVGAGLPIAQLNPTEVRTDGAGTQQERELGPADGADDQHRELEDEVESSHAGRQEQGAGGDTRTCHYCCRKGHLRKDCPKLSSGPSNSRGEASRPDQNRGQISTPRVNELSKDEDKAGPFQAITGNY